MMANGKHDLRIIPSANHLNSSRQNSFPEPTPVEKFNWLIHLQHTRGETEACKILIKTEISNSCGKNEYAHFKQGTILREEGKIQAALESFQICLKLNPDNADNLKQIAGCLYDMGRFRLSLEAYLEAEKVAKTADWEICFHIGECLMRLGDITKAKDYAEEAVKLGKHEKSYALLVKILITEGDLKSAVAVSNAAVEICPDSGCLLTESGLLLLKSGQTQHAFERLGSALALDHNNSKALLAIGCITQKYEEYEVALNKYKIAILHEPDSVALWNNIGMCFHSKQKYVAAISCLKRALWISPLHWKVLFNLGLVHLSANQPASAFNFVCAAVNLRSDVADAFAILASALVELKDPENGVRAFKQAMLLKPNDAGFVLNTAVVSELAGLTEEVPILMQKFRTLIASGVAIAPDFMDIADVFESKLQTAAENQSENVLEKKQTEQSIENLEKTLPVDNNKSERELDADEV